MLIYRIGLDIQPLYVLGPMSLSTDRLHYCSDHIGEI